MHPELAAALRKSKGVEMDDGSPGAQRKNREPEREKQADVLAKLALARAEFWHAANSTAFVDIRVEGHRETWPLRSHNFKLWLARQYYESRCSAPNSDAAQSALNVLEAKARFDGREHQVDVRIAGANGKIYIDLGTRDWSPSRLMRTAGALWTNRRFTSDAAKGCCRYPCPSLAVT